jgi:hypothetical protein
MANKNLFNSVEVSKPKKNVFDLTHDVKMSSKMGQLTPTCVIECVPGDMFNIGCDSLIRFAPLLAPVMHRMDVSMHYFFVPNRITWENWEKFIVDANTNHVLPYLEYLPSATAAEKKFLDYLGVPPNNSSPAVSQNINALPLAAYQAIYNEYYRDQNLVPEVDYKLTDGNNIATAADLLQMRLRAWEHDYFTSALPFAQKGAAVDIPIGQVENDVPVRVSNNINPRQSWSSIYPNAGNPGVADLFNVKEDLGSSTVDPNFLFVDGDEFDISATTINDLRRAFRLQEWLEKNARGGTRYIENILMHFGVKSSDKRLQRPEYITGVKTPVVISEVLNTTGLSDETPQGNMAGHAVAVTTGKYGTYFCEEHGYIIGIMSVMPKTAYQQGIPKTYLKNDPLDFFWPSFAHIGEQPVTQNELYAYTNNGPNTFGYVPRYAEYKFMSNRVAGDFRTTLAYWHLGRIFNVDPTLSQQFIECAPEDVDRIFAVTDDPEGTDNLYCQVLHKIRAVRPMPKFGTPMF